MIKRPPNILSYLVLIILIFNSCSKNNSGNQVEVIPIDQNEKLSIIVLLGDGMGISQITAAWYANSSLNLQRYPHTGLVLTHTANKLVTESGSSNTSMMTGVKTNYGFIGINPNEDHLETLYEYLRKQGYYTGIISTSFMTDATMAALFSHRKNRHDYEDIAYDYYHEYPDFGVAGGQKHFDAREDHLNLLDSLQNKGVHIFHSLIEMNKVISLPAMGMMYESLPPYLLDGRDDFLFQSSKKALNLFANKEFFLFIEGAQIDKSGHDMNIENQVAETLEFDRVSGLALDYAQSHKNVLVVVLSDHECGGLSLMQGDGFSYIPNFAANEHSGEMVPIFAFGPGAENFSGIMDNTDIYEILKHQIDSHLNN